MITNFYLYSKISGLVNHPCDKALMDDMRHIRSVVIFLIITGTAPILFAQAKESDTPPASVFEKQQMLKRITAIQKTVTPNQLLFDITGYHLRLNLHPSTQTLEGMVTISGRALETALDRLEIDLGGHMTIDQVLQSEDPCAFSHTGDMVYIALPTEVPAGGSFSVTILYHGNPELGPYGAFRWDVHGPASQPVIWTLSEPYGAPSWWPCKDDPADKADSVRLDITVPENLVAASNGLLAGIDSSAAGVLTYQWITRYPISTYLVSLAVSDYLQFQDIYESGGRQMPLSYFVYPELYQKALQDFAVTRDMLVFFSTVFGEYPFIEEKYGMAVFGWGGAMEHQTLTSYGAGLVRGDNRYDYINAHELAHQWFGDLITMRYWSHIWLNEGFASYAEALWYENLAGEQGYHDYMRSQYRSYFPGSLFITDTTNTSALFSGTVYDKGSWVLHMLRGVLGDTVFFDCLRDYATNADLIYGNATTEDFQAVCERISGRDLAWFFDQWVYREGRPDYSWNWHVYGSGPYSTELNILQNTSVPFIMPIEIRLQGPAMDVGFRVWNDQHLQKYTFKTKTKPTDLIFDPGNWILKYTSEILQDQVLASQNYPNPFNTRTQIDLYLPDPSEFNFIIFNTLGQQVYRSSGFLPAGYHPITWEGGNSNGDQVSSGMYFARLQVSGRTFDRKLLLLR